MRVLQKLASCTQRSRVVGTDLNVRVTAQLAVCRLPEVGSQGSVDGLRNLVHALLEFLHRRIEGVPVERMLTVLRLIGVPVAVAVAQVRSTRNCRVFDAVIQESIRAVVEAEVAA